MFILGPFIGKMQSLYRDSPWAPLQYKDGLSIVFSLTWESHTWKYGLHSEMGP